MPSARIAIVAAQRSPIGAFLGALQGLSAPQLGAHAIRAVLEQLPLEQQQVDEVYMGCVLPAGCGQAPARQAALGAGLPQHCGATTVNKVCGSGLKAVMLACDAITAGSASRIVAGGMESMSNAPYLLARARAGLRMGHTALQDHMFLDGLENAYDGKAMGCFAQSAADSENITREAMDDFARESLLRAQRATQAGYFRAEIAPLSISTRSGNLVIDEDEGPTLAKAEKIPHLKPAFAPQGSITAANSSSISDGAAALYLMREAEARRCGLAVLATVVAHASHAQAPEDFTRAPVGAIEKVLRLARWKKEDVDVFEINEAFAMVTLLAMRELKLPPERVNIRGGACALGHPIGASGARILVTLIHALRQENLSRGVATLCIGGGEAVAMAVARPERED